MKKLIILYTSMLINIAAAQQQFVGPCPPAPAKDKQALIAELVCLENYNKELILQRNQYDSLLRIIRGKDGSDCLGIRCINTNELSIKVVTNPEGARLQVEFGRSTKTPIVGGQFTPVKFTGIIGTMANDVLTDECHRMGRSMSHVRVINAYNQGAVAITSVELRLLYPNNTYKTVFTDANLNVSLPFNDNFTIVKDSILSNQAYLTAAAGSCHD